MRSRKTIAGLIVGAVAVATLAFSSTFAEGPSRATATSAITSPAPAKPPVVRVSGMDFSFDAPDVIPAGLTEFRFMNKGPSLHHMQILKLEGGKTVDDLRAALANPGPPPAWVRAVGGPNAPAPGVESNATLMMEPGNYALICFVDIDGPPHFMKGMVRALRVAPSTEASALTPKVDVTPHCSITDSSSHLRSRPARTPFVFSTAERSPTRSSWCSLLPASALRTS